MKNPERDRKMPARDQQLVYRSGEWEIDLARRELRARRIAIPIGSRAFALMKALVQSAGEIVAKDELMGQVWAGANVEENTLDVHISAVRRALGPDRGMLQTVYARGYRLLGNWSVQESKPAGSDDFEPARRPVQLFQTNVALAASDLVGRVTAVRHLRDLLSAYRVVTLTGPGGIGKTVLALEAARSLLSIFQGDVWLVELAAIADPGLVPSAVAGALRPNLGVDDISPEVVARAIGGKKVLLVLDNCEHVIGAAARLAEAVVRQCPCASFLATSREALRIDGEFVFRVPPLDVPPLGQQEPSIVLKNSAVQLFIARTTASGLELPPTDGNLAAITAICRRLDGIPLAIELAAACTATLGLSQVASHLDDCFELLTVGRRTALPRHQTLRATIDWSYELLPEVERSLLRRLAVFPAGFTLEAAIAVGCGNVASTVEGVANLVAKSLLTLDGSVPTGRWRLLETIRAYALDKLADSREAEQAARLHAQYFRDLFASATPSAQSHPTAEDMVRCAREIDNVRAALDRSFSPTGEPAIGSVLAAAYAPVWLHLSLLVECRERVERALDSLDPDSNLSAPLRMQLHIGLGVALFFTMGSVERTRMTLVKAFELAESLDDADAQLRSLWTLAALHFYCGECRVARSTAERFSRIACRTGDTAVILLGDRLIGNVLQHEGKPREAQHYFERVIKLHVAPKDLRHTMWFRFDQRLLARAMLARALCARGFLDQARNQSEASLEEAHATNHKLSVCGALHFASCPVALMTGDLIAAQRAVAMLIEVTKSVDTAFWGTLAFCFEGKLQIARGNFAVGSVVLRSALDACDRTGWTTWYPEFLGALAEGSAGLGQLTEAFAAVERALACADRGGERWYVAELLRIKGELLLQDAEAA